MEHQIFRFAEMILHDRCSTLYDPPSLFRGRRNTLDSWSRKHAKRTSVVDVGLRPNWASRDILLKESCQIKLKSLALQKIATANAQMDKSQNESTQKRISSESIG